MVGARRSVTVPRCPHAEFPADEAVENETEQGRGEADACAESIEHPFAAALLILEQEHQAAGKADQHGNEEDDDENFQEHAEGPIREPVRERRSITYRFMRIAGEARRPL